MSAECDSEYEARSSDGSDSEGSLVDFILKSDDDGEISAGDESDGENADSTLVNEFPYDPSLLEESNDNSGPRRSRRQRKSPVRYVDDKYAKLMFDDVEMDKIEENSDEDAPAVNSESDDDDYEQGSDESSDGCSSESDTEDQADWQDEEPKSNNEPPTTDATATNPPKTAPPAPAEVLLTDPPTIVSAKRSAPSHPCCVDPPSAKKPKVVVD